MSNYKCKKGFIMTPDETSGYEKVPFFIQIRDVDIVGDWNKKVYNKVVSLLGSDYKGIVTEAYDSTYKFTIGDWDITVHSDLTYDARVRTFITNGIFDTVDGVENVISKRLYPPMDIKADTVTVDLSMSAFDVRLCNSPISFRYSNDVSNSFVHLVEVFVGNVPTDLFNDLTDNKNYLDVTIHGKLK